MRHTHITASAACVGLALSALPVAAQTVTPPAVPTTVAKAAAMKPAEQCTAELTTFNDQMAKDGYWMGGSRYGYGYPMGGYGYGYGYPMAETGSFQTARPGYEVRVLLAAANVLARNGQQDACASVLGQTRTIYAAYLTDMHARGVVGADGAGWQRQQITAAQPVTGEGMVFRSDQLLDSDVRSAGNDSLGSVHDLVMSPKSGKIAYVVVARGGLFGLGQSYTPVPWADFKTTRNVGFLVLDTTKTVLANGLHP